MLASLLALGLALPAAPAPALQDEAPSLQELLAAARAHRAEAFARLRPQVQGIMDKLEVLGRPRPEREITSLRAELDGLGPEAAPLLLPYLDPGPDPRPAARFRAREVLDALQRVGTRAVTEELGGLLRTASLDGRINAIRLLGSSPEPARAGRKLRALFPSSKGTLRLALARALVQLGTPEDLELVLAELPGADTAYTDALLEACAANRSLGAAPSIAALVGRVDQAREVLPRLQRYYAACPEAVDEAVLLGLLELVGDARIDIERRTELLGAISDWPVSWKGAPEKRLEALSSSSSAALREGALILLANLGDRGAKREVLDAYDNAIDANPRYSKAYEQRGDILMRLGEYGDAARDYKKAVELKSRGTSNYVDKDLRVRLARALALDGKAKLAYEALRDANLARSWLRTLASDPDFAILVEHSRYSKLFE